MVTRKGTKYAKEGNMELWVIPAEASGWRAEVFVRRGGDRVNTLVSKWTKTKAEAVAKARGMKRKYF